MGVAFLNTYIGSYDFFCQWGEMNKMDLFIIRLINENQDCDLIFKSCNLITIGVVFLSTWLFSTYTIVSVSTWAPGYEAWKEILEKRERSDVESSKAFQQIIPE